MLQRSTQQQQNCKTYSDEDGFIKQVGGSLKEVQEKRLGKTHISVWLNIRVPASSEIPIIILWLEVHLIKDGVVAFSDAGPLSLSSNCYLDNRLDVYARQLSALNDTHADLDKILDVNN